MYEKTWVVGCWRPSFLIGSLPPGMTTAYNVLYYVLRDASQ